MIPLYSNVKALDLHGLDRNYSRILINDFIKDHYNIKEKYVMIVHGIGSGALRKETQETLKKNRFVKAYRLDPFNPGTTLVELKEKIDKIPL